MTYSPPAASSPSATASALNFPGQASANQVERGAGVAAQPGLAVRDVEPNAGVVAEVPPGDGDDCLVAIDGIEAGGPIHAAEQPRRADAGARAQLEEPAPRLGRGQDSE